MCLWLVRAGVHLAGGGIERDSDISKIEVVARAMGIESVTGMHYQAMGSGWKYQILICPMDKIANS